MNNDLKEAIKTALEPYEGQKFVPGSRLYFKEIINDLIKKWNDLNPGLELQKIKKLKFKGKIYKGLGSLEWR